MFKKFITFACLLILYCSCYKANNTRLPASIPVFSMSLQAGGGINVSGGGNFTDSNNTIKVNDSLPFSMAIYFSLISGNPENYPITCFISGLPAGISLTSPDSVTFKLSSQAGFNFSVATADTGVYTYYVNIRTPDSLKSYPVHVHVLPVPDGAPGLAGTYAGNDPCGHFSIGSVWYTYTAVVSTIPGRPHWISIQNYRGLGDSVIVNAFVTATYPSSPWVGSVSIPLQTVNGYTIYGSGNGGYGIQENEKPWISIYGDTIIHAGDTQTCYLQLTEN